jgi:hypothetical protein
MTIEEDYQRLLASGTQDEFAINTITISHSLINDFYLVADNKELIATDEDSVQRTYLPSALRVDLRKNTNDLDQSGLFTLAVDNNALKDQLDLVPVNNTEQVLLTFRIYLSSDLSAPVEIYKFVIQDVTYKLGVATFTAGAPQLDLTQSGIRYTLQDFPTLVAAT